MAQNYAYGSVLLKALADESRLMIVDMLSCGELCACEILEKFEFSQPALSQHMKILRDCRLVNARKEGRWTYYSLSKPAMQDMRDFLHSITTDTENCICKEGECDCGRE